ncbi:septum site-determining protein MinC [candidate division KSB3 bacterium]|uniref:Septum site-determining protein MinC n=1 Tax=candidate division KSB3 bacterium TaxID=2044937 RepID=A0A9D5JYU5_9BACT|nr:septum site-determining protein MinC [candidate division KSB3 bacterium]MBD3326777.1 septum site-determining protein MinC [candidate division KSB3 bacterium]
MERQEEPPTEYTSESQVSLPPTPPDDAAASVDTTESPAQVDDGQDPDDDFMKVLDETFRIPIRQKWKQRQTYTPDYLYENEESAFYFRGTVRSGQSLEFPGNVVILGDINPGAYVVASGDILVMGRLHGVVHAGAEGEERAVVVGVSFNPSQLRIAQYIGRPPDERPRFRAKRPQTEKAYIKDGAIVIEPIL